MEIRATREAVSFYDSGAAKIEVAKKGFKNSKKMENFFKFQGTGK